MSLPAPSDHTEADRIEAERARIRTFVTRVSAVEDVHPRLRRITFRGGDLASFAPAGPDTFLYLLLPPPGRAVLTVDASFSWEAHAQMPDHEKPVGAYYTLRAWRPECEELDILVVLHGDVGHASRWAARATAGDPVALWGPRTAYHPPPGTEHVVLVADETGLPAVAGILEQLPPGITARVLAEVPDEQERQELPARDDVEVTWLHRGPAEPGTTSLLLDAVRSLPELPSSTYVWGGGESRAMAAIRGHVRTERGLPRDRTGLIAYWRRA
jgi:NADPH-dependent ferric siderophore reductase